MVIDIHSLYIVCNDKTFRKFNEFINMCILHLDALLKYDFHRGHMILPVHS